MASNFISEDFETSEELPKDNGFILEVYETNYHFEKRFAVHGYNTVGQLILFIVQEIGKSFFLSIFFVIVHYDNHFNTLSKNILLRQTITLKESNVFDNHLS